MSCSVRPRVLAGVVLAVALGSTAACGLSSGSNAAESPSPTTGSAASRSTVAVVASTDVWGDVVSQIGGDAVKVTSIISDPHTDPHSYEADAHVQLELSRASVVVRNGGGDDDFVGRMLAAAGTKPTVLDAVDISGKKASAGGGLNEHLWYDMPTVQAVAHRITATLSTADPAGAPTFAANEKVFDAKLARLTRTEAAIRAKAKGKGVAITEPVPLYMTQACGLVNRTPDAFSKAIEEGTDVPASVLQQTLGLFDTHEVSLLAYNQQTSGPETTRVLTAAEKNKVTVVPVTETLPRGKNYLTWMSANLAAIMSAVGS